MGIPMGPSLALVAGKIHTSIGLVLAGRVLAGRVLAPASTRPPTKARLDRSSWAARLFSHAVPMGPQCSSSEVDA
jgi:hypothetical protein